MIPTGGLTAFGGPAAAATGLAGTDRAVVSPDLTGDGIADLVVQAATAPAGCARAPAAAPSARRDEHDRKRSRATTWSPPSATSTATAATTWSPACPTTGRLDVLLGRGNGDASPCATSPPPGAATTCSSGVGDVDGDGTRRPARPATRNGALGCTPGPARAGSRHRVALPGTWTRLRHDHRARRLHRRRAARPVRAQAAARLRLRPARRAATARSGTPLGPLTGLAKSGAGRRRRLSWSATARPTSWSARAATRVGARQPPAAPRSGTPIATGVMIPNANALLNAGDWDRDGLGDIISRTHRRAR